ncbi:MAG: hypothetical protein GX678_03230, partial [Actinomycetales bacterium]|nr:hypothetical protein [Actinomycetales bacterium]
MRLLSAAFSALVVVLCFGLASCGSGSAEPDASAKPSASPTPTATPPTKPANWNEPTPEAAADFVGYWIDVFNFAYATGDLTELKKISGPDCEACNVAIEVISKVYGAGGYVKGNSWSAGEITLEIEPEGVFVTMEIAAEPGELTQSKGALPTRLEPMERTFYAWVD